MEQEQINHSCTRLPSRAGNNFSQCFTATYHVWFLNTHLAQSLLWDSWMWKWFKTSRRFVASSAAHASPAQHHAGSLMKYPPPPFIYKRSDTILETDRYLTFTALYTINPSLGIVWIISIIEMFLCQQFYLIGKKSIVCHNLEEKEGKRNR